jgi:hypothetical protein
MQTKLRFSTRSLLHVAAVAGFLSVVPLSSAFAAQTGDEVADHAETQAREAWRGIMHETSAPSEGCFHASYPSTQWQEVECAEAPGYRSALPKAKNREQTVGNGYDYVVQAPSGRLLNSAIGSFPKVTGVKSEKSVGVAAFGDGGILGPNEYTLQVNTNFDGHSPACDGYSYCLAWQQYAMSTNTPVSITSGKLTDKTEVFIEYWLINYGVDNGSDICPSGFIDVGADSEGPGDDCVQNTKATVIAKGQLPITDLASLKLSGSAKPGGTDAATVTYDTEAYTATVSDRLTGIASGWTQAEFNVLGNASGSKADFNTGSSVTVKVAVSDGSSTAPTCVPPSEIDGTTGETNNLTLGKCTAAGGSSPSIQFTESH